MRFNGSCPPMEASKKGSLVYEEERREGMRMVGTEEMGSEEGQIYG